MVNLLKPLDVQEASNSISLYFHLPFCKHKCAYCHFFVLPDKEPLKHQLMEGLALEWEQIAPRLASSQVHTLYFGGGTPWLMGPENISLLIEKVKRDAAFTSLTPEITLEANPENVTEEEMLAFFKAGVNRISIGIQSLDPSLLKILDRQHSAEKAKDAVHMAHACGIQNITVDLMYDLPGQTLSTWERTLKEVQRLPITHLSLYNLTFEPHTAFYKHRETLLKQVPDESISLNMYRMAVEQLESCGLAQYEISAFSKAGFISQHNTGYWLGRPFLGLGPSAFSDWDGARFQNVAHLGKYLAALREGKSPVDYYEKLDPLARRRELLAVQIRLLEGVDLAKFQRLRGALEPDTLKALNRLQEEGFIDCLPSSAKLTQKGILFYDTVASELI